MSDQVSTVPVDTFKPFFPYRWVLMPEWRRQVNERAVELPKFVRGVSRQEAGQGELWSLQFLSDR